MDQNQLDQDQQAINEAQARVEADQAQLNQDQSALADAQAKLTSDQAEAAQEQAVIEAHPAIGPLDELESKVKQLGTNIASEIAADFEALISKIRSAILG